MILRFHKSVLVLTVTLLTAFRGFASNEGISNSYQTAVINKEPRVVRSVTHSHKNCETWASWVNDNHPSSSNREDNEFISKQTLGDFCPLGRITKFQCKDNNGEPFLGNITTNGVFSIYCYDIYVGVVCKLIDQNEKCPDMAIRYYCSCKLPPTTATTQTVNTVASTNSLVKSTTDILLKSSDGPVPSQKGTTHSVTGDKNKAQQDIGNETTLDIGSFSMPWWAFVLVVSGLLFIINTCISVCLYRKGAQRLKKKHKRTIHPLQSV